MKKILTCLCLAACLFIAPSAFCQDRPAPSSLYERVGGYNTISVLATEFLKGIRSDARFARFTGGRSADSLARATQLLKDQLCALSGGPCTYIGREMKTAHGGLGISGEDWTANMRYFGLALDKAKIAGKEKTEFLSLVDALKSQIVEK